MAAAPPRKNPADQGWSAPFPVNKGSANYRRGPGAEDRLLNEVNAVRAVRDFYSLLLKQPVPSCMTRLVGSAHLDRRTDDER